MLGIGKIPENISFNCLIYTEDDIKDEKILIKDIHTLYINNHSDILKRTFNNLRNIILGKNISIKEKPIGVKVVKTTIFNICEKCHSFCRKPNTICYRHGDKFKNNLKKAQKKYYRKIKKIKNDELKALLDNPA